MQLEFRIERGWGRLLPGLQDPRINSQPQGHPEIQCKLWKEWRPNVKVGLAVLMKSFQWSMGRSLFGLFRNKSEVWGIVGISDGDKK